MASTIEPLNWWNLLDPAVKEVLVNVGRDWLEALKSEFHQPYFISLCQFVVDERKRHTVYPHPNNVFAWTTYCNINDVRVVILGQDPYYRPGQATGLAFDVPQGIPRPQSLANIYREVCSDIGCSVLSCPLVSPDGFLIGWAKQGVLLLNSCLTVQANRPNSHRNEGWELFTDAVLRLLSEDPYRQRVFILWGKYAKQKYDSVGITPERHLILISSHPSPLAAYRSFVGSGQFSQCNEYMISNDIPPINWYPM